MSQKRKNQRAQHELKEQQQANKVVIWIAACLLALGVLYMIYSMVLLS